MRFTYSYRENQPWQISTIQEGPKIQESQKYRTLNNIEYSSYWTACIDRSQCICNSCERRSDWFHCADQCSRPHMFECAFWHMVSVTINSHMITWAYIWRTSQYEAYVVWPMAWFFSGINRLHVNYNHLHELTNQPKPMTEQHTDQSENKTKISIAKNMISSVYAIICNNNYILTTRMYMQRYINQMWKYI